MDTISGSSRESITQRWKVLLMEECRKLRGEERRKRMKGGKTSLQTAGEQHKFQLGDLISGRTSSYLIQERRSCQNSYMMKHDLSCRFWTETL